MCTVRLALVLCAFLYSAVAIVSPLQKDVNQTILPCQTKYYSFTVNPTSSQFYFQVVMTTDKPLRMTVVDKNPESTNGTAFCLSGFSTFCATSGASNCTVELRCALAKGTWYAVIENAGLVGQTTFSMTYTVLTYKASKDLGINDKKEDPVRPEGTVMGPDLGCTDCDVNDIYDYYKLTIPRVDVVGSRLVINVKRVDNDTNPINTYLTYKTDVGCRDPFSRGLQLEIGACQFSKSQGDVWYLTVQRSVSFQNYTVKAYVDRPRIVPIAPGFSNATAKLLEPTDVIYFQFNFPTEFQAQTFTQNLRMTTVVDNVDNGLVELTQDYQYLPGTQGCGSTGKICTTTTGCVLRYDPCEITDRRTASWYIGVRAISLVNPNRPVTFTISTDIQKVTETRIAYDRPLQVRTKLGTTDQYKLPLPPNQATSWVNLRVYFDASEIKQMVNNTVAVLYVNNGPLAGGLSCYGYARTCKLERSAKNIFSCSIQLDPCELSNYASNGGITFSVWPTITNSLYWYQQTALFTFEADYFDPVHNADRRLKNGAVLTESVNAGEYQLYRVDTLSGQIKIKVEHQNQPTIPKITKRGVEQGTLPQIRFMVFPESSNLGPNCPCWLPIATYTIDQGQFQSHVLSYCNSLSLDSGLIVAVQGLPFEPTAANPNYVYATSQFVISVETTSQSDPTVITTLRAGAENVIYDDVYSSKYYRLSFPRENLFNKAIVIKTRTHSSYAIKTSLKFYNESNPVISCNSFNEKPEFTCTSSAANDGYCTITKKGCSLSDYAGNTFMVEVTNVGAIFAGEKPMFNIYFELVDQSARPLPTGNALAIMGAAPVSALLERDLYHHYYLDVSNAQAGKKTLIIEAFVDQGLQYSKGSNLVLYMNTPDQPSRAGATDCLCHTSTYTSSTQGGKILVVINSCELKVGRYYFGFTTSAPLYDTNPTKYTVWASVLDPLIQTTTPLLSDETVHFDVPYDMSLFFNQRSTITFAIPDSFATLGNPVDTAKDISIKITTTRNQDVVTASLSTVTPLNCGCFTPDDQCTTSTVTRTCSIPVRYCTSGAPGIRYLELTVTGALDRLNPVPFTVLISRATPHKTVTQLTVVTGCSADLRTRFTLNGLTENQYYQHYQLVYQGTTVGEEVVQFYFQNVTDGNIIGNIARGNLATLYCPNSGGLGLNCPENPSGECQGQVACTSSSDYFSVFASSTNNNNPVSYKISACRTSIQDYPSAGVSAGALGARDTLTYRVSLKTASATDTPTIVITVAPPQGSVGPFGMNVNFKQSTCKSCPTSTWPARSTVCAAPFCTIIIPFCQLPANYAVTDFFLSITSTVDVDTTFDLIVAQTKPGPATTLTSNQKTTVNLATGNSWALLTWTLTEQNLVNIEKGVQRAFIKFVSTDNSPGLNIPVASYFSDARSNVMCSSQLVANSTTYSSLAFNQTYRFGIGGGCCTKAGTYYVAFFNPTPSSTGLNPAVIDVTAVLDQESEYTRVTWNDNTQSASANIQAKAYTQTRIDATLPPIISDTVIRYPGLVKGTFGWTNFRVTQTSTAGSAPSHLFVNRNLAAGPDDQGTCYAHNVYPPPGPLANFSGKFEFQLFECSSDVADYWFGARTYDLDNPQTFSVSIANAYPKSLAFGSSVIFTMENNNNILFNYYVDIPSALVGSRRNIKIIVETTTDGDSVQAFVNKDKLAGNVPGSTCVGALTGFPASAGFGPLHYQGIYPSCTINAGRLFIGIKPVTTSDAAATTIPVNITVVGESTTVADNSTALQLRNQLTDQTFTAGGVPYNFLSGGAASFSKITYFTTLFTGLTSTSATSPSYTWFRAGKCTSAYDTMYCNNWNAGIDPTVDQSDQTCSSIIFPCNALPSTNYEFNLNSVVNATDSYTIEMRQTSVDPIVITQPGEFQVELNAHELKFLKVSITSDFFQPAQNISIGIKSVSCGSVGAWINQDVVAGPNCFATGSGTCNSVSSSCNLFSVNSCDLLSKDLIGDYWVTLRGKQQFTRTIPIKVVITVTATNSVVFEALHLNEKHTLRAFPLNSTVSSTCSDISRNTVPVPNCCPLTSTPAAQVWRPPPTYWVLPVEGASYLENGHTITITLQRDRVQKAVLAVTTERPDFCSLSFPSTIQPVNVFHCFANVSNNYQCTFTVTGCAHREVRQLFVFVRELQYVGNPISQLITDSNNVLVTTGPVGGASSLPLLYITSSVTPYSIVDINPSREPQYLRFRLTSRETQYYRIAHDNNSNLEYYARATLIRVQGGTAEFTRTFDTCAASSCSQYNCKTSTAGTCTSTTLGDCTSCGTLQYQTCNININRLGYSFFQVDATSLDVAGTSVWGLIKFEFYVNRVPVDPNICDQVGGSTHKYYRHSLAPGKEQIYRFDIRQQSTGGSVTLYIAEDILPVRGMCSTSAGELCDSPARFLCTRYYRKAGTPQLSVYGTATTGVTQFYNLNAQVMDVPVITLTDGVRWTTPTTTVNATTKCVDTNLTQYYKFTVPPTATNGSAFLVQYEADSNPVYMYKGHVTYQWGTRQCQGSYCNFLVACGSLPGDYYFHATSTAHKITVSTLQISPVSVTLGAPAVSKVLKSHGDFAVFQISGVNGNQVDPTNDLYITFDRLPDVKVWVTRGAPGDETCKISTVDIPNGRGLLIPSCQVRVSNDNFYVHFLVQERAGCVPSTISVRSYLQVDNSTAVKTVSNPSNLNAAPGDILRAKFSVGVLGDEDVVKVRIPDLLYGKVTHKTWKGNWVSDTPPCETGCSQGGQFPLVSYYDNCWHCGMNTYDTVFVDVTAGVTADQYDKSQFSITAVKSQWTDLSNGVPVVANLSGPSIDVAFFTAPLTSGSGNLLELFVVDGYAVEVHVLPKDCTLRRSTPIKMWCFEGQPCQIPFSMVANFGSFDYTALYRTDMWADKKIRIAVFGHGSVVRARYMGGRTACTAYDETVAPYCGRGEAWGTKDTFSAKDDYAKDFYSQLERGFSCAKASGCACKTLTQVCKDRLKQYACENSLMKCSANGLVSKSSVNLCTGIQNECGRTWEEAGFPSYSCQHNFYPDGTKYVPSDYDEVPIPPGRQTGGGGASSPANLLGLWIFLGILGFILLLALIFVCVRFVVPKTFSTPASLQDDNAYTKL